MSGGSVVIGTTQVLAQCAQEVFTVVCVCYQSYCETGLYNKEKLSVDFLRQFPKAFNFPSRAIASPVDFVAESTIFVSIKWSSVY